VAEYHNETIVLRKSNIKYTGRVQHWPGESSGRGHVDYFRVAVASREALDLALDADLPRAGNDLDVAGHRILAVWFRSTLVTAYVMR
jgi:hypothetical protein